jgi:hypothetical protein
MTAERRFLIGGVTMNCTHPVLYERKDGLYCVVCHSVVAPGGEVDKNPAPEEKPAEAPKPKEPKEDTSKPAEAPQNGSNDVKEPTDEASLAQTSIKEETKPSSDEHADFVNDNEAQNEGASNNEENKGEKMENKEFEPVQEVDAQEVCAVIEEASKIFNPSEKAKLVAYIIGDILIGCAILLPDIVNIIQAPTLSIMAEYASKTLITAGTYILLVFKLIKKKK